MSEALKSGRAASKLIIASLVKLDDNLRYMGLKLYDDNRLVDSNWTWYPLQPIIVQGFLVPVSKLVPLTYGINLFEGIMLKGWGIKELWVDFLAVIVVALVSMFLAALTVKDRMDD